MEICDKYFFELGRCKHYEMKCVKYENKDEDKFQKYHSKYQHHKMMAAKHYNAMKETAIFSDFLDGESIFTDSRYFTQESTNLND